MRNTSTLSRPPVVATPHQSRITDLPKAIPSIRLISATPSASGNSSTASASNFSMESSWASIPTPLAPKSDSPATRKRLVPKKSKLSMLGVGTGKEKDKGKDLSDVVRRVGGASLSASASHRGGAFEIYVDPAADEEVTEIVMVKRKKSRAALDGMRWGSGALSEVTNVPAVTPKEAPALLKVKAEGEGKWWSIGRGRKDSKEKTKEAKNEDFKSRAKCKLLDVFLQSLLTPGTIRDPYPRSKTPEPLKLSQEPSRARFNSLDSGILLNTPINMGPTPGIQVLPAPQDRFAPEPSPPLTYSRAGTPTAGGLLAPAVPVGSGANVNQGSIALRAMRSVRSIARIGSWAQLRNEDGASGSIRGLKPKEKVPKEKEEKKKKKKEKKAKGVENIPEEDGKKKSKKKDKDQKDTLKAQTLRLSTSSFEVGAASPMPNKTLVRKKRSILGLGLPSTMGAMTMRLPTVRNGSTASSTMAPTNNRLSVESAGLTMGRDRAGSVMSTSTASSLRPMSTTSSMSGSRISSGSSVRWDEECLENVRELRRKERREKEEVRRQEGCEADSKGKNKESRRSSEGRRRTPLSEVFPDAPKESPEPVHRRQLPIVTVEAATADGHSAPDDCVSMMEDDEEIYEEEQEPRLETPVKKARARPLSEQMLGRSRPRAMHESEDGVLSILDAATNDLAQLINHLDLEATPGTPDMTPLKPTRDFLSSIQKGDGSPGEYDDSPTKRKTKLLNVVRESPLKQIKGLKVNMPSISSLRPYAQSRCNTEGEVQVPVSEMIGQQIAPWPTLIQGLSPVKESSKRSPGTTTPAQAFRMTHKRTLTPAPEPEPSPVFQPLRPSKSKNAMATLRAPPPTLAVSPISFNEIPDGTIRAPSSLTFGSRSSSRAGSKASMDELLNGSPIPSPVFKRATGHVRQRSSLVPFTADHKSSRGSQVSLGNKSDTARMPIPRETRRILGLSGTMGGSDVSGYDIPELDASDPDSDIPDELQLILSNQSDEGDTLSFREDPIASLPGSPPEAPLPLPSDSPMLDLPIFRLVDDDDNHADLDEAGNSSEEDTKKSFDFTGEIQKLNESGGSDRRSFVEQLENAFRTPAKIDLSYGFPGGLLGVDIPPVPKLPISAMTDDSQSSSGMDSYSGSELIKMKEPTLLHLNMTATDDSAETVDRDFKLYSQSQIIDAHEPTLLPGSDSLASSNETYDIMVDEDISPRGLRSSSSSGSRPSDGQLNTSFKFGGLPKVQPAAPQQEKPKTLSDIIPPPSHVRSLSNSSMLDEDDSILKSIFAKAADIPQPRARVNSDSSVKRRARENYYRHSRHSSGLSFAGFDSFDEVRRGFEFNNNSAPFYPPPASRRYNHNKHDSLFSIASVSSYGHVLNAGSTDPFDYGLPSLRERPSSEDMSISMSMSVDDTFSFLDRNPRRKRVDSDASSFYFQAPLQSFARGHRRHESNMSVNSLAPPISLFNRGFGGHRRNDSSASGSSVAHSYAMHGANGGRAAWARHRQDSSMDSVMSDFSVMRLGRPGVGDKMFDTAGDHHMPLTSISASPPESLDHRFGNRASFDYDSIMDDDRRSSMDDSLFDKTGRPSSISSDSVFGFDNSNSSRGGLLPPGQFRPLSIISMNSTHSPMKEDDTMISMLGGGHVRRRSVHEFIEASPCVRVEKRKHAMFQGTQLFKNYDEYRDTPNKARIIEKPSIASTSSCTFGGERMIKAKRGLLERQSLEDSCLIADGEDLSFQIMPVFSRPGTATRSRSSTYTSSSGGDTPPLSSSDGFSSMSEGSQSSIDLSHVNMILANATHPMTTTARQRVRARARGHGHRRRASQARASRSSVYETIQEEMSSPDPSPMSKKSSPTVCQPIFIVEPDTASMDSPPGQSIWDDERGIVALRKYYALRDEAQDTVTETFQPPRHPSGMQALLEHSVQNYGPLPSELRPRRMRSRTQSRPSPYPQARVTRAIPPSPEKKKQSVSDSRVFGTPLQQIPINHNILSVAPSLEALKPFSPLVVDIEPKRENAFGLAPHARPRVASTARRTALGWSKRSTGKSSTDQKENIAQGTIMTPGESLRINRPRPRGRPTPASQQRPIRV
ncbi:hypothetical protein BDZ94DRAFT_1175700 [Collybia nuda]|uniref:Uncharacterized protein n=1 Tax=Collybia nuda TaxID=64659 RepID=A0A9P6CDU8_9AGAR|nr:hypothetical protein BDZ94DRAFT_1175700 [Collybia nuda]